jgi:signal peptidase I
VIFGILKVSGGSLSPVYQDGDYVLVSSIPILVAGIRPGNVIVFRHPTLGRLVKLVDHLEQDGQRVFVVGLDPFSRDSRVFGAIPRELVLGKVIGRVARR